MDVEPHDHEATVCPDCGAVGTMRLAAQRGLELWIVCETDLCGATFIQEIQGP
jgi:predicted RNA-binding Zn-ribbon protein involved in translation (DUF1610 family)